MEEDDQQATCGHERSPEDSIYSSKKSPGHTRGDAPEFEGVHQYNGQTNSPSWADSKPQDRSLNSCSSGHSIKSSVDYSSKSLTRSAPSLIIQQQAIPRTSLDDLQTRHPRRLQSECRTASASAIALPLSRSSSIDQLSIRDPRQSGEPKSVEQPIVRPDRAGPPGEERERGRARLRAGLVPGEKAIEREEPQKASDRTARQQLQQSLIPERESIRQRPEDDIPRRPEASKFWKAVLIALKNGELRQNRRQQPSEVQQETNNNEADTYRINLLRSAARFSNLRHASTVNTRHIWSSHIVLYDILETQQSRTSPETLWPDAHLNGVPTYEDFRNKLRRTPPQCPLRVIFVEDLNPSLIEYLGAAFQIPPGVFEIHLDGSGFVDETPDGATRGRWMNHSSSPDCSSLTWFRPIIPLLPVSSDFRNRLLHDRNPKVRCMVEGCEKDHELRTTTNILRRNVKLCPCPGAYQKGSETEYPIAREERVTIFTRLINDCKFAIVLLDPLPFTRVISSTDHGQHKDATHSRMKIVRFNALNAQEAQNHSVEEWATRQRPLSTQAARPESVRSSLASNVDTTTDESLLPAGLPDTHSAVLAKAPAGVTLLDPQAEVEMSRARVTGSVVDATRAILPVTGARRRSTGLAIKRKPSPDGRTGASTTRTTHKTADRPDTDRARNSVCSLEDRAHDYNRVIPYHPIKAGSSSSAIFGDTFTTLDMPAYIERLHVPISVIGEFEAALQSTGKGKEKIHDPLQILFRIIHDDCHNLTDVIRDSLHRIRQDTLNEDVMQQRVTHWRKLHHRFNSTLAEVDQQLRSLIHFQNDKELFYLNGNQRTELPSERLARDASQNLRNCLNLVERSSTALLTEMQIVDSRRSIAEAESVSKLTELAFVFIPLSFVASLFSMQVKELSNGVPLYVFALAAAATVFIAYAMRLSIRSSRLIAYKTQILGQIHAESHVPHNQPLPTHIVLRWLHTTISRLVSRTSTNAFVAVFPLVLVGALTAAVLSPVILLGLREIDKGFTAVIIILVLSSNAIILIPLAKFGFQDLGTSPMGIIRDVRRWRKESQKRRTKSKRQRINPDPEAQAQWRDSSSGERVKDYGPRSSENTSSHSTSRASWSSATGS